MWLEKAEVRLVWITMLAMADRQGRVFGSVPGLAHRARVEVDSCKEALARFMAPDEDSRTKEFDGRRIEEIDGGWRLLNHEKYRALKDEESIKESKRLWARRSRESKKSSTSSTIEPDRHIQRQMQSSDTDTQDINRGHFVPPALAEVEEFGKTAGLTGDFEAFFCFYESKGWMVGKNKMKNWRAAYRGWCRRSTGGTPKQTRQRSLEKPA